MYHRGAIKVYEWDGSPDGVRWKAPCSAKSWKDTAPKIIFVSGDCRSRFPGDLAPAVEEQPRPPHRRPPQHLPQAHQVLGHLPHQQQVTWKQWKHETASNNSAYSCWTLCKDFPPSDLLLKQLLDHCLFNPSLWIHTPAQVIINIDVQKSSNFLFLL